MRFHVIVAAVLVLSGACGDDDDATDNDPDGAGGDDTLKDAVATYSRIVLASYEDSLAGAEELDAVIGDFLADPTAETLADARDAWLTAREPYLQTEAYRFYDGPIDNPDDGPEGQINAWPLDEAYIDYVEGDETAGIINDPDAPIDAESLLALNEQGGEKNIATGFHAIEFLLWGQDLSEDGPGDRPHTDFVVGGTADNQERRGQYLQVTSALLVEQLEGLVDAWKAGDSDNYRAELAAAKPKEALRRILTGITVLSGFETGGERLQTAYDTGDQEDEHSCFSDNTDRDMVQDVRGIQNVYLGSYERTDGDVVDGTSIEAAVAEVDEGLAEDIAERMEESFELAKALEPPFDREIAFDNTAGRKRVLDLIDSLVAQEKLLMDVFTAFELEQVEPPQ
jgi:putative iron-regulated protein